MSTKFCTTCKIEKPLADFRKNSDRRDGLDYRCKLCRSQLEKVWHQKNPDRHREYVRRWRKKNPEKDKRWAMEHPEQVQKYVRNYRKRRRKNDPEYRLLCNTRRRLFELLEGKKLEATMDLLGCNAGELKSWLSGWFEPGMTWENYGKVWHVDHHFPCASFDLSILEGQRKCFHYLNLRPLFASDNLSKGAKIPS